jgi:hypothetical protein
MSYFEELYNEIEQYKREDKLKKKYISFITDKTIDLDLRWKLYCHAPASFKNENSYIVNFEAEKLLESGKINWYDDFYRDRYCTVYMKDIVQDMYEDEREKYSEDFIQTFKEEILELNLDSFINDW